MNDSACANLGLAVALSDSLTSIDTTAHLAAAVLFIPLAAFTVVANGVIIVSLLLSHLQNLGHGCAINVSIVRSLIVSMAVSDAIIGCFSMPLAIYELFMSGHWELGQNLCLIKQSLDVFLCTVSIYHVTCMAVDRYLAVCKPLTYRTLSIKTGYLMIGVSWGVPAALSVIPFLGDWHTEGFQDIVTCFQINSYCSIIFNLPYQVNSAVISFYIPMVTICALYYLIARKIWLVSKTFSSKAFRNSFWRLRRNFYSLSKKQRQPGTSTISLTEINGNWSGKEADRQLNNTRSQVKSTYSQTTHTNKAHNFSEKCGLTKSCLGEQQQQQQQQQQQDFLTIADSLLATDNAKSSNHSSTSTISNLTSIQPPPVCARLVVIQPYMPGNEDDASFHFQYSKSVMDLSNKHPAIELEVKKSASLGCILPTKAKTAQRLSLLSYQASYSRQVDRRRTKRSRSGFGKMKAVKTIGSVVVCFTLCWMPFSVYIIIQSYYKYALPLWPYEIFTWLGYLNSALNPIVYCGNKSIRQTVSSYIFQLKVKALYLLKNGSCPPPAASTDSAGHRPSSVSFNSGIGSPSFTGNGKLLNVQLPIEIINSQNMMGLVLQGPLRRQTTDFSTD